MFTVSCSPTWFEENCFFIRGSVIVVFFSVAFPAPPMAGIPEAAVFADWLAIARSGPAPVARGGLSVPLRKSSRLVIYGKMRLEKTGVREDREDILKIVLLRMLDDRLCVLLLMYGAV
jgi:hypothetical protein